MRKKTDLQIFKSVINGVKADNALTPQKITDLRLSQGLKAGTQILLANGTCKNIEDIKYGDMLKSWNWVTKKPISVKAYGAIALGYADTWTRHIFQNGLFIDVNTDAYVYSRAKGIPQLISTWEPHFYAHTLTNERIHTTWTAPYNDIIFTSSYLVLCETGLYFANGLLCAHMPQDLYKYYVLDKIPEATEQEIQYFTSVAQMWKNNEMQRIGNPLYLLEIAAANTVGLPDDECRVAKQEIQQTKKLHGDSKKSVHGIFKEIHEFQIAYIKAQQKS